MCLNRPIIMVHTCKYVYFFQDIQKFIDEADYGVILFSLGSLVRASTLTIETQKAFRDAFAEIPQKIIWKFEEEMENLSRNVMMLKWLPQREILGCEFIISFILE